MVIELIKAWPCMLSRYHCKSFFLAQLIKFGLGSLNWVSQLLFFKVLCNFVNPGKSTSRLSALPPGKQNRSQIFGAKL